MSSFRALVLDQTDEGPTVSIQELDDDRLPDGDVTIDVEWSSLNYKDGMILRGIGRLVRNFPHVPGVDLAGHGHRVGVGRVLPRRPCGAHRLPRRRGVVGRLRATRAREVGVVGEGSRLAHHAPDDGDRHRRPHRDAVRRRPRARRAHPRRGSGLVHRRGRRRGDVRRAPPGEARLRGHRVDGTPGRSRLPEAARRGRGDRPRPRSPTRRRSRCCRSGGPAVSMPSAAPTLAHVLAEMRYGASVAACGNTAGNDVPDVGAAVHPAQRAVARRRLRDGARPTAARRSGRASASSWIPTSSPRPPPSSASAISSPSPTRSSPARCAAASSSTSPPEFLFVRRAGHDARSTHKQGLRREAVEAGGVGEDDLVARRRRRACRGATVRSRRVSSATCCRRAGSRTPTSRCRRRSGRGTRDRCCPPRR